MKRRRKRARRNPPADANAVLTIGGIAGVAAGVFGARKVGGLLFLGAGTYALFEGNKNQQVIGGLYDLVGALSVLV